MSGRFITFEGIDGTGKGTQIALLVGKLKQQGYDVLLTKEPGSPADPTTLGQELRQILFHTVTTKNMAPGVADFLFLADHIQNVEKVIKPALAAGRTVISDRYSDSQFAYAPVKGTPAGALEAYRTFYGPVPDITILLLGDPAVMLPRARARRGEAHQEGKLWNDLQDQRIIQQTYLSQLVGQTRVHCLMVNEEMRPQQVFDDLVWPTIDFFLAQERLKEDPRDLDEAAHYGGACPYNHKSVLPITRPGVEPQYE
jgi:dTMP kinase